MTRGKRILIYKIVCVLFAVTLLFLPQRGLPYSDIRVLATVLGIDGGDGNVEVSVQLAVPVAQNSDGKASTVAKASGGSLGDALENLEIGLGRRVDYGHLSAVAVGDGVMLVDLKNFLGYLLSSGKAGPGAYLVYCEKSSAGDFIQEAQDLGESSDAELSNYISYSKNENHVATTTVLRFLQTLHSTSSAAYIPCVRIEDENEQSIHGGNTAGSGSESKSTEQQDANEQSKKEQESKQEKEGESGEQDSQQQSGGQKESKSGGSGQQQEEGQNGGEKGGAGGSKKKLASSDSVAVYGGEEDGAKVLNSLLTRGVVWQDRYSHFGLVELRNVAIDGTDIPSISTRLSGKRVKRIASVQDGENVLTYKIKLKLEMDDAQICGNPLFYDKWKSVIEDEFATLVQNNIMLTVAASKETGVDFLGIKECFHKFCRKGYENFELSKVVVKVEADVNLTT